VITSQDGLEDDCGSPGELVVIRFHLEASHLLFVERDCSVGSVRSCFRGAANLYSGVTTFTGTPSPRCREASPFCLGALQPAPVTRAHTWALFISYSQGFFDSRRGVVAVLLSAPAILEALLKVGVVLRLFFKRPRIWVYPLPGSEITSLEVFGITDKGTPNISSSGFSTIKEMLTPSSGIEIFL